MGRKTTFGLAAPLPGKPVGELVDFTVRCEEAGLDAVWFPDHVLFMAKKLTPEAWSVITAAAAKTRRIRLGAIGDPHRSHPAMFAHRLATVDNLSGGRVISCLGYGEKMNLDYYGIEWNRPLARLRESVTLMRRLWAGEAVTHRGEFHSLSDAEVRISPVNGNEVPVYVAATGPVALGVAGEIGNGWVTNAMPARVFSKKLGEVEKALSSSPDPSRDFEKCIFIFVSIAPDREDAYRTLDAIKHAIIWPDVIDEAGYDLEIAEEYRELSYTKIMPNDPAMLKRFREMGEKYYTREILSDFVVYGTAGDAIKRFEQYAEAGVTHFIVRDFSPDLEYSLNALSKEITGHFS